MLPLEEEGSRRVSPLTLERGKFLSKSGIGENEQIGLTRGILESELQSRQQSQELIERKRAAETDRKFKEQQLLLQKKQLKQQEEQAKAAMWAGIPIIGPLIGGASSIMLGFSFVYLLWRLL